MTQPTPARDGTKDQLLRAAIRVFGQKGYQTATVREICQKAGANVAAVNYHFGGKEALYAAVLEAMFADSKRHSRGLTPPPATAPAEERLAHLIERSVREVYGDMETETEEHCQALSSIFLLEMGHPSPGLTDVVQRYVRADVQELHSLLGEMLERESGDDLVKDAATCIMGQVLFYSLAWPIIERLEPENPAQMPALDRLIQSVVRFSLAGLAELRRNPL